MLLLYTHTLVLRAPILYLLILPIGINAKRHDNDTLTVMIVVKLKTCTSNYHEVSTYGQIYSNF